VALNLKTCSRTAAVLGTLFAVGMVIASWVFFERPYATLRTMAAIGPFGAFVAIGIAVVAAAFARKPRRPSNYPRIEHLRIAGKYQAVGGSAEMGFSPLHLRG
jgi:hypothetical protein